ncbi:MAG: M56 family metallopeptidase [Gaiellaceae bacterium]
MSERPNVVFALILVFAGALTAAIAIALMGLGLAGVATLGAAIAGALTACVVFLAELDKIPLSSLVVGFLALASAGSCAQTLWLYVRERRLLSYLPLTPASGALASVARDAGIHLWITPARGPSAFCFGLLRPRVVVTSGLLERLSIAEQTAVIWHEAEHAHGREPAKCLVAGVAARTFFWIPAIRDLLERFLLVKEVAADRRAVARTSMPALAGALHEVAGTPSLATIGAGDLAAARIERLFAPQTPLPPVFRRASLLVSAFGIAALTLSIAFSARLDLGERTHLRAMLTSPTLHGLPGMAAGLALNGLLLSAFTLAYRRLAKRRSA